MAPQANIPSSATVLGLIGTVFWCIQMLPQLWHSYSTKSTEGLPSAMLLCWSWSSMPFSVYAVSQNFNVPLWVQPQCFGLLSMVSWGQCKFYGSKWPAWKAAAACAVMLAINAGCQVAFILLLRPRYEAGLEWPVFMFGLLATICVLSGYLPIPYELMKRRGRIVGISLLFLLIDCSGAVFSLLSLVAQNTFDPLFGVLFSMCAAIELSMFISHGIWLFRTRGIRKRAKAAGIPYDEYPEAIQWQDKRIRFRWRGSSQCSGRDEEKNDCGTVGILQDSNSTDIASTGTCLVSEDGSEKEQSD